MVAYNVVNHSYVDDAVARASKADFGVIAMKVARPVHPGTRAADPDRLKLIDAAVPGGLKPAQKAYVWALRNPNISAVNSEMVNQQLVDENLPLAGKKTSS